MFFIYKKSKERKGHAHKYAVLKPRRNFRDFCRYQKVLFIILDVDSSNPSQEILISSLLSGSWDRQLQGAFNEKLISYPKI